MSTIIQSHEKDWWSYSEDFQYSTFTLFLPVFHKHPVILIYLLQRANHFPAWFVLGQFLSCSVYGSWLTSICSVKFLGLHLHDQLKYQELYFWLKCNKQWQWGIKIYASELFISCFLRNIIYIYIYY